MVLEHHLPGLRRFVEIKLELDLMPDGANPIL